jgi:DNA-binding CsgD family transcriptional regulator
MTSMSALERGRQALARQDWQDAVAQLCAADTESPLEPEDLEGLASAAYLIGKDSVSSDALSRAHHVWLSRDNAERAARVAFWLVFVLLNKGQHAHASGWLARGRRLLDDGQRDCVERGYMLIPTGLKATMEGDIAGASAIFREAAEIGERFNDRDLMTLGRQAYGRTLINLGSIPEGVALLDEVMIAVTAGEVSPVIVGTVYCSVIEACHEMFDLRRAHEWTAALGAWCALHADVVPYRGHCQVRRAEILQLHGAWLDAIDEASRACEALSAPTDHPALGAALYQRAELHRLRGEFAQAEEQYRRAAQRSRRPQPGLAQLRLAQGNLDLAVSAIGRVLDEARDRRTRPRVLAAYVEIALAARDVARARAAANELRALAEAIGAPLLHAMASHTEGAVLLDERQPRAALTALQRAMAAWRDLEAPYEVARVRTLAGLACRALGDEDSACLELDAAREEFERLGAAPALAWLQEVAEPRPCDPAPGLTGREVEVLRLLATGRTNRAIAEELGISEKTVARHISNIFTKLDLSSRAAATAYAYEHALISPHT